jgi:hypothetical protein
LNYYHILRENNEGAYQLVNQATKQEFGTLGYQQQGSMGDSTIGFEMTSEDIKKFRLKKFYIWRKIWLLLGRWFLLVKKDLMVTPVHLRKKKEED